ncbi:MAG: hypothetical protein E8D40_14980 [Nitrospira sp.]|nr:MAG: hypothetical protein E8D40_14980 [Nitrospira sp.]
MNSMSRGIVILVLAVVGLVGSAHEGRSATGGHPRSATDLKAVLRDLWSGHNFWLRNIALDNTTNNRKALDYAEKSVTANARQIAKAFTPFYGEAASEQLFTLLVKHSGAIKAYSEATVAGSKSWQDAAKADYASNTEEIATFLSEVNRYLPKDTVRGLFAVHGAHQFELIKELQEEDYGHEAETWQEMEQHGHAIADTLTTALERQFPNKFSGHVQ